MRVAPAACPLPPAQVAANDSLDAQRLTNAPPGESSGSLTLGPTRHSRPVCPEVTAVAVSQKKRPSRILRAGETLPTFLTGARSLASSRSMNPSRSQRPQPGAGYAPWRSTGDGVSPSGDGGMDVCRARRDVGRLWRYCQRNKTSTVDCVSIARSRQYGRKSAAEGWR